MPRDVLRTASAALLAIGTAACGELGGGPAVHGRASAAGTGGRLTACRQGEGAGLCQSGQSQGRPATTLTVSLEAIFLSTFVLIAQNRAAEFQQAKADHDFNEQETELKANTQLTREIHELTTELHRRVIEQQ